MRPAALVAELSEFEESAYEEWEAEEKTPLESDTLRRMIGAAVKNEMRPLVFLAVAMVAVLVGLMTAMAFTLWGPG